jgi:hypothetical protein
MHYTKLPKLPNLPYLCRTATGTDRWEDAERNQKEKGFKIRNIGMDFGGGGVVRLLALLPHLAN